MTSHWKNRFACMAMALALSTGAAHAQAAQASSQDKDFLKDTAEDSNYEIKTAQLALKKSPSADVKTYARMLIQDHTQLNHQVTVADKAAGVEPVSAGSMSVSDRAEYTKLELLSGKTFDESYIKTLAKGNEEAVNKTKAEASGSGIPAVKQLAAKRAALDTKHTDKAKQLAQAHGVQTN